MTTRPRPPDASASSRRSPRSADAPRSTPLSRGSRWPPRAPSTTPEPSPHRAGASASRRRSGRCRGPGWSARCAARARGSARAPATDRVRRRPSEGSRAPPSDRIRDGWCRTRRRRPTPATTDRDGQTTWPCRNATRPGLVNGGNQRGRGFGDGADRHEPTFTRGSPPSFSSAARASSSVATGMISTSPRPASISVCICTGSLSSGCDAGTRNTSTPF